MSAGLRSGGAGVVSRASVKAAARGSWFLALPGEGERLGEVPGGRRGALAAPPEWARPLRTQPRILSERFV